MASSSPPKITTLPPLGSECILPSEVCNWWQQHPSIRIYISVQPFWMEKSKSHKLKSHDTRTKKELDKKVTCVNDLGDRIDLLIYHKRLWPGEDLHVCRQVATLENSMERRICQINQLSRTWWLMLDEEYYDTYHFFQDAKFVFPLSWLQNDLTICKTEQNQTFLVRQFQFWKAPKQVNLWNCWVIIRKSVSTGIIDLVILNLKGNELLKITTIKHFTEKCATWGKWNDTIRNSKIGNYCWISNYNGL